VEVDVDEEYDKNTSFPLTLDNLTEEESLLGKTSKDETIPFSDSIPVVVLNKDSLADEFVDVLEYVVVVVVVVVVVIVVVVVVVVVVVAVVVRNIFEEVGIQGVDVQTKLLSYLGKNGQYA